MSNQVDSKPSTVLIESYNERMSKFLLPESVHNATVVIGETDSDGVAIASITIPGKKTITTKVKRSNLESTVPLTNVDELDGEKFMCLVMEDQTAIESATSDIMNAMGLNSSDDVGVLTTEQATELELNVMFSAALWVNHGIFVPPLDFTWINTTDEYTEQLANNDNIQTVFEVEAKPNSLGFVGSVKGVTLSRSDSDSGSDESIPDGDFTKATYVKTDTSNPMWVSAEYKPENVNGELHVDWGDGSKEVLNITDYEEDAYLLHVEHEYEVNGEYIVKAYSTTKAKSTGFGEITKVTDWGSPANLQPYFYSDNLIEVPSTLHPELTSLVSMFGSCTNFNQDISTWDTSNVTSMGDMFAGATSFNQDISNWVTSKVTDMQYMFHNSTSFNQDISSWDVSKVTNMTSMFVDATSFSQDLSQWCVSLILTKPSNFDTGATVWTLSKPIWGTCPRSEDGSTPPDPTYSLDLDKVTNGDTPGQWTLEVDVESDEVPVASVLTELALTAVNTAHETTITPADVSSNLEDNTLTVHALEGNSSNITGTLIVTVILNVTPPPIVKFDLSTITNGDEVGVWTLDIDEDELSEVTAQSATQAVLDVFNVSSDIQITYDQLTAVKEDTLITVTPNESGAEVLEGSFIITINVIINEVPPEIEPVDPPIEEPTEFNLSMMSNVDEPGVWELDCTHIPVNSIGEYKEAMSHRVIASAFPTLISSDDYTPDTLIRIQPETLALSADGGGNNFYIVPYANTSGFNFTGEMLVRVVTDPTNDGFVEGALDLAKLTNIGEMGVFEFKHRDYDNVTPDRYVSFIKEEMLKHISNNYEDSIGTPEIDDLDAIFTVTDVTASHSFTPEVVAFSVTSTVPLGDLVMTGELLFKLIPETTVGAPKNILGNMSEVFEFEGRSFIEPDPYSNVRSYPLDARHVVPTSRIADHYYTYGGYDVDASDGYFAYQGGDVIKYVRGDSIFFVRANKPGVGSRVSDIQSEIVITRIDTNPEALDITTVTNCGEPGVLKVPMSLTGVYETDRTVYDDIAVNAMNAVLAPYLFDAKYEGLVPDLGHYGRIPKTAFVRSGQPTDMVTGTLRVEPIEPDSTKVYLGDLLHDSGNWTSALVDGELDTDTIYSEIIAKVLETTGIVIEVADLTSITAADNRTAVVYGVDSSITGPTYGMLTVLLVPGA